MTIDIRDILTLDDNNKYLVISKINYENRNYYYLIDVNANSNIKFCYEKGDELVELNDKSLITKLIPLFDHKIKGVVNINKLEKFN